jgi:hypothetical protein
MDRLALHRPGLSPSDWEQQSQNMGAIYMNAVCNIAAAGPAGGGLFTPRSPFGHFSPHVYADWSDASLADPDEPVSGPVSLRGFYTIRDSANWYVNVDTAHLNQRRWVSQERELSPCTLTFGSHQVYWKCGEVLACESFPNSVPGKEAYHLTYTTQSFRGLVKDKAETDEVVRYWYGFVKRYSVTELTQKRDRLPAAYGMAQELLRLMPGNRFLAGLFESHLAESLLWRRLSYTEMSEESPSASSTTTVITNFQVPSWSWASLNCAVICDAHKTWGDFRLLAKISREFDVAPKIFVYCTRLRVTTQGMLLSDALQMTRSASDDNDILKLSPDIPDSTVSLCDLPKRPEVPSSDPAEARKLNADTHLLPIMLLVHFNVVLGLLVNPCHEEEWVVQTVGAFEASFKDKAHLNTVFDLPEIK